ncbi:tripartite tricarboxylate transporter TctB family protein [Actinophytocola gossypii]|uniref:Tripartite tricarboxylate transporter TctB family protein n=1 Tax=Actinophytocola gossypii TaxID=2812003 RepID=A0ABT2J1Z3_9PSEU|nr:tripartite tricarboxylate transporter TctB family protein [Actinophytocola gossypii]MCT2581838.1 tripartite tricarboxylate transporter TctB family protein [Actinophytocola gossypii]
MSRPTVPDGPGAVESIRAAMESAEHLDEPARWSPRGFRLANLLGAGVLTAFSAWLLLASLSYAFQVGGQPGPGFFPRLVAGLLLVLGLVWFGTTLVRAPDVTGVSEGPPDRPTLVRVVAALAVVTAAAFALMTLGYPLTIAAAVAALALLAAATVRTAVVTGVLFAVTSFLLVTTLLGIQLPLGVLRPFLVFLL